MTERVVNIDKDIPPEQLAVLRKLGELAARDGKEAWLVGGLVRDLFLGVHSLDLDVVVEGDGIAFARNVRGELKADVVEHPKFMTATLTLPGLVRVDVATARTETYEKPGALPKVEPAAIKDDMRRRDFTINAMAVCLAPARWGELFDPFGGRADIENKKIRILHDRSFMDDPTRILRGCRFAARFGFEMEEQTKRLMDEAVKAGAFNNISPDRLREEFFLVFVEPEPAEVLRPFGYDFVCRHILGADWVYPGSAMGGGFSAYLDRADNIAALVEKGSTWDPTLLKFLLFMRGCPAEVIDKTSTRFNLSATARKVLVWAPALPEMARKGAELGTGDMDELLGDAPLEVKLAVMVMMEGEEPRRRLLNYLRHGWEAKPELTGADLVVMGFNRGPVLGRILDSLRREKLDGKLAMREDEEEYVRKNFSTPDGGAAA